MIVTVLVTSLKENSWLIRTLGTIGSGAVYITGKFYKSVDCTNNEFVIINCQVVSES